MTIKECERRLRHECHPQPLFPKVLTTIQNPVLAAMLAKYDAPAERMRYILELFRSRQQNQRLLQPTFTAAQVTAMKARPIQDGPLS